MHLNIRTKVIIFLLLISVAGVASLLLMINRSKHVLIQEFKEEEMKTVENFIVGTLKPIMLSGHGNLMSAIMASYKNNLGVKDLRIIRTNGVEAFLDDETLNKVNKRLGQTRFTRDLKPPVQVYMQDDPALLQVLSSGKRLVVSKGGDGDDQITTMLLPIPLEEPCKACHGDDHKYRGILVASFGLTDSGRNAIREISSLSTASFARLLLALGLVFAYLSWAITNRISKMVFQVNSIIGSNKLDQRISDSQDDEIGRLSISFNHFISAMEIYREEEEHEKERLEKAVFEKTKELREKNDFIENDLRTASRIQQKLMPEKFPDLPGISFHAEYRPSLHIGGDYYDVFEMPNDHLAIFMADASGHGSSAALLVSIVKAIVSTSGRDINSPGYVVQIINSTLASLTPDDSYVTLFYGVVNLKTRRMLYSLAGHPAPIVHNRKTGAVEQLKTNGGLVGIFDFEKFEDSEYTFKPGDRIFVYTDGLVEATIAKGKEQFGKERIIKAMMEEKNQTPRELTEYLRSHFEKFTGGEALADDITILVVDNDK